MRYYIGIDIGSTSTKTAVLDENDNPKLLFVQPTGWSSVDTAEAVRLRLKAEGYDTENCPVVATGYGRVSVPFKETALMRRFYNGVKDIQGVHVYGDLSQDKRCAIVALNIWDYDSGAVADALAEDYDIAVRPGAHCAPRMHKALGTTDTGAVRFSFSYFNTEEEIDAAVDAIKELAE